jgi:hypothetical protein
MDLVTPIRLLVSVHVELRVWKIRVADELQTTLIFYRDAN